MEGFADSVCLRVKCLGFGVFNVVERQVQRVPLSTHDDFLLCSNISRELSTIAGVVQMGGFNDESPQMVTSIFLHVSLVGSG